MAQSSFQNVHLSILCAGNAEERQALAAVFQTKEGHRPTEFCKIGLKNHFIACKW